MMMRHDGENLPIMAQTVAMGIRPEDISKVLRCDIEHKNEVIS